MPPLPPLRPEDVAPVVVLLAAALAYSAYHFLGRSPALDAFSSRWRLPAEAGRVVTGRLVGAALLGGVPLVVSGFLGGPAAIGVTPGDPLAALAAAAAILVVLIPLIALQARRPAFADAYPALRDVTWTPGLVRLNGITWALYLLGYEIMFRGLLVFGLAPALGFWPAIAAMTALYVVVHLPKNATETFGALPMGVLLGLIAWQTGTVLGPWLAHTGIALAADHFGVRAARRAGRP